MLDTTKIGLTDHLLSIPDLLKASPVTEGDSRYLYLEASNEARDFQGEIVRAEALAKSAGYYEQYGNVDIQHRSMIGLASGDPQYHLHEIGRPEQVRVEARRTFVKAVIFSGDTPVAACANDFWDSITKLRPPQRWFPSVGGKILESERDMDPETKEPRRVIKSVLWCNIGLSRTPINPKVPTVSTVPFGVLAKCWGVAGLDLTKALTAGYGTDSAALSGGAALRRQSLDGHPQTYPDFRERLAKDLLGRHVQGSAAEMLRHAQETYGLSPEEAGDFVERFMKDLRNGN